MGSQIFFKVGRGGLPQRGNSFFRWEEHGLESPKNLYKALRSFVLSSLSFCGKVSYIEWSRYFYLSYWENSS